MLKLCFLDWDDSLLCSSAINGLISRHGEEALVCIRNTIELIDGLIIELINSLLTHGYQITIVTNATMDWISHSCLRYLPKTGKYLKLKTIPIISASDKYFHLYPDDPPAWKKYMFKDLVTPFIPSPKPTTERKTSVDEDIYSLCGYIAQENFFKCPDILTAPSSYLATGTRRELTSHSDHPYIELLSIGDSVIEQDAVYDLASTTPFLIPKVVKLLEAPDAVTVANQLRYLIKHIDIISRMTETSHLIISSKLIWGNLWL